MSDYKRIVSYIYDYQNGLKKNNVGFARVEARNDQCKIMINIKAPSLNNNTLKAYIFHRKDDTIMPISLGNIFIKNGIGDYRTITRVNDIMNSSNTLDQMCGIIVYFDDEKYYATEWDDKPVILNNFNKNEVILNEKVPILDSEDTMEQIENFDDDLNTDEIEYKKEDIKEDVKDFIEELIDQDNKENIKDAIEDVIEEEIRVDIEEDVKEIIKNVIEDVVQEEIREDLAEDMREIIKEAIEEELKEEVKEEIKEESITSPTAARIFSRYTKMFPFEDDEISECVRIEPQDIGAFPIENWVLGNNSFLLHGYYNYRHLIFARRKSQNGSQYIIGVPGFFQSREKFMAKLFGFEDFKPIKEKEPVLGEFGYWYTTINI